jgi:hypothetical protein
LVAVKCARIPDSMPWYSQFAQHTWLDLKLGGEHAWWRVEVASRTSGTRVHAIDALQARRDHRWTDEEVELLAVFEGARARRIAAGVLRVAHERHHEYIHGYEAWPGPNSNTFARQLCEAIPELHFAFDHNAVGKDYDGWASAGLAPSRTGLRLDTLPLGVTVAAREGLELHVAQLSFGLQLWPPRLQLPFLPEIPWSVPPRPAGPQGKASGTELAP